MSNPLQTMAPTAVGEFITVRLAEKDWTFRALDLDQIEALEPQFELINQEAIAGQSGTPAPGLGLSPKFLAAVAEVATASLQHQHAGVSTGQVRKLLTLATLHQVMAAVRGVSSLQSSLPGEAQAAQ